MRVIATLSAILGASASGCLEDVCKTGDVGDVAMLQVSQGHLMSTAPVKDAADIWYDKEGNTCNDYIREQWCTAGGGYGDHWNTSEWFDFQYWATAGGAGANEACCGCGCKTCTCAGYKRPTEVSNFDDGYCLCDGSCVNESVSALVMEKTSEKMLKCEQECEKQKHCNAIVFSSNSCTLLTNSFVSSYNNSGIETACYYRPASRKLSELDTLDLEKAEAVITDGPSSVLLQHKDQSQAGQCCVTLYQDCNFKGGSVQVCCAGGRQCNVNRDYLEQFRGWCNDCTSSVWVAGGDNCRAFLYEHANFGGVSVFLDRPITCLGSFNDQMGSMIMLSR